MSISAQGREAGVNMTADQLDRWTQTKAFKSWKEDRDQARYRGYVMRTVIPRTRAVIRGTATSNQVQKVNEFISRHRSQDPGQPRHGMGRTRVSSHTAALRSWGYDPTGRFS